MVGVPGRSKACQPCKKRRVACDLRQPKCSRCVKNDRDCEYQQGTIFVFAAKGTYKTQYRKTCAVHPKTQIFDVSQDDVYSDVVHQDLSIDLFEDFANAPLLFKTPSDCGLKQQALVSHALVDSKTTRSNLLSTILSGNFENATNGSLYSPFLACYTSWLGRRDRNQRLIDASHEFYIRALKETHAALFKPQTAYADATLAACHALGIYEALECPAETLNDYQIHRAAAYRLMKMRGPYAHIEGEGHKLFRNFRLFGVLHAFDNKQPTYLSSPEWMSIPWQTHPKTIQDQLIDIIAQGAEVMSTAADMEKLPLDQGLPMAFEILYKLAALHQQLLEWYKEFKNNRPSPLCWEQVSPNNFDATAITDGDEDLIFHPPLQFRDLETCGTLCLYWSMLVMIWSGLTDLYDVFSQTGMTQLFCEALGFEGLQTLTPESMRILWLCPARKVCQSVAFCTTAEALESGPPRISTQLVIVVDTIKHRKGCEVEYEWATRARKRMGEKWLHILRCDS